MFNLSYDEIISKIKEEKQITSEEIDRRIKEKLKQLSDLISKEGAAHILANELGVKIINIPREVKINALLTGMNNVWLTGKVLNLNKVVSYNKNGKQGKVGSFILGDETGKVRVALWDTNHINHIENGEIKEETILKIKNAYVKANNGYKELHVGSRGELEINPPGMSVEVSGDFGYDFIKKKISELNDGDMNVGIFGTIVQVYELRFYDACPKCGKKLENLNESYQCKEHGLMAPEGVPILNLFLDDGTDNLRAVAFRSQVERLLNASKDDILEIRKENSKFDKYKEDLLGKQFILVGRINRNEMFDRKEMTIQRVIEINPESLLKEMQKEVYNES